MYRQISGCAISNYMLKVISLPNHDVGSAIANLPRYCRLESANDGRNGPERWSSEAFLRPPIIDGWEPSNVQNPVQMIGHEHEVIEFDSREVVWDLHPTSTDDSAEGGFAHIAVFNVTEHASSFGRADS
jgi:hypothetical protein